MRNRVDFTSFQRINAIPQAR